LGSSWRVSEEPFMDNVDWMDNLTLKASYGTQGNNRVGLYAWQAFYDLHGTMPTQTEQRHLQLRILMVSWEKNASFNTGFDALMLDFQIISWV